MKLFASLLAISPDPQTTADLNRFESDLRAFQAEARPIVPALQKAAKQIARDESQIRAAMRGTPNSSAVDELLNSPDFNTIVSNAPGRESQDQASLSALDVPEPLVDRLFADRRVIVGELNNVLAHDQGRIASDARALLTDGLRVGIVQANPADPLYQWLNESASKPDEGRVVIYRDEGEATFT